MATRFEPNRAGIAAFGRSQGMQQAMGRLAEKVKARAERISPVRSGQYKAGWRTASGVRNGRAFGRIYNIARDPKTGYPYPRAVEFGTERMKKQRVLGRALDALREAR